MQRHPNAITDTLESTGIQPGDSPMPQAVQTDRLVMHRAHPDHIEFDRLHALFGDLADPEEVFARCGWDKHDDVAQTETYLDNRIQEWERGDRFEFVLESTNAGKYAGSACVEVTDDGAGEFGLWLRKPYWGQGLSGEGTDALIHLAFNRLDVPFVIAGCLPENHRSRRAIEKFVRRYGGAYVGSPPTVASGDRHPEGTVLAHHEWVITADQFDSGRSGLSTFVPGVEYDDLEF